MLAPACAAIRAHIEANYSALPIRWPNEDWPNGENPQTEGRPFIEVEIIGGKNRLHGFGIPGQRVFVHPGIIRFYICEPTGAGMTDAVATADQLALFMERTEFGRTGTQAVRTFDFSTYDNTATLEEGSFSVLAASCPFEFWFQH